MEPKFTVGSVAPAPTRSGQAPYKWPPRGAVERDDWRGRPSSFYSFAMDFKLSLRAGPRGSTIGCLPQALRQALSYVSAGAGIGKIEQAYG
jgi:hypothetical protein